MSATSSGNLVHTYLQETGQRLKDFEGECLTLANEVLVWLERQGQSHCTVITFDQTRGPSGKLYFKNGMAWNWHSAVFDGQHVHDAWVPEVLDVDTWIQRAFHNKEIIYEIG